MTTSEAAQPSEGRRAIWPGNIPPPAKPYSPAITAGGWVFVAGQLASDYENGVAPAARNPEGAPYLHDELELQSRYVLSNLSRTLEAAGADIRRDLVRIYQWFTSPYPTYEEFEQGNTWPRISITPYLRTLYGEFAVERRPASTGMGVRQLLVAGTKVEVDMIAIPAREGMVREDVPAPEGVPAPLAGYSPGVRAGDWVFLAGEIPVDWMGDYGRSEHYGEPGGVALEARTNPYFWYGVPIEAQTEYVLRKLDRIARAAGSSLERCVKATVYLGHPKDFAGMDRVWRSWFPSNPPARVVIPYMGLGGMGSRIEVAMKLLHNDSPLRIEAITADDAAEPLGHEPQAVKAGDFVFFSTQLPGLGGGLAPNMVRRPEFPYYGLVTRAQVDGVLDNVSKICSKAGTSLANIVRRQCFHTDFTDFAEAMDAWARHFPKDPPASTTIEIGGPLFVPGAKFIYDLIAYAP
jgi:enamine deaminase RidA (YjgF/YER057c/UK114 family)